MSGSPIFRLPVPKAEQGRDHAGLDTSKVRPMTPLNADPGLYSLSAILGSLFEETIYKGSHYAVVTE